MKRIRPQINAAERFFTVSEAAPLLHLHRQTVQEFCSAGKITCTKPGSKFLIPESAISEYLTRRATLQIATPINTK